MAEVGKWGSKVKFYVDTGKQLSFTGMKRSSSGRWAAHNIIGQRPKPEFLGPSMDEVTMDVVLDASMGINPRKTMKAFRFACKKGKPTTCASTGKKSAKTRWPSLR